MFTNRLFSPLIVVAIMLIAACTPAASANPADRFAGTWSGTMSFTDEANRQPLH